MGLPGHRRTSSHKRRRASHFAMVAKTLSVCPKCNARRLPHIVCSNCGFYKDHDVLELSKHLKKTADKKTEKKNIEKKTAEKEKFKK